MINDIPVDCNLVFLDFDGVLNDRNFDKCSMSATILDHCMGPLNCLLDYTDSYVVVSSAWRYCITMGQMTVEGFSNMMRSHGMHVKHKPDGKYASRIIGHTETDDDTMHRTGFTLDDGFRGEQIRKWREDHGHIGKFVILDDLDLRISEVFPDNFVHIDSGCGICYTHVKKAIEILNGRA